MSGARGVVLVTGAGQRVGQAIARHLGTLGWRVAVHYGASAAGAAATVEAIRAAGGDAEAFGADLRAADAAPELIDAVVAHFGSLDALVNSAAGMERSPIGGTTAADFDRIIALNLRAPFLLAQAAAGVLRDGGAIVNIADHMADEPWPDHVVHGVSKAGDRRAHAPPGRGARAAPARERRLARLRARTARDACGGRRTLRGGDAAPPPRHAR
jgi:pteridine reductase